MNAEGLEVIRARYATEDTAAIAAELGCSGRTVYKYAKLMGLEKDPAHWHRYRKGERPCTGEVERRRVAALWEAAAENRKREREGLPRKKWLRKSEKVSKFAET